MEVPVHRARFDKAHGEGIMYVTETLEERKFEFVNGNPIQN